MKITEIKAIICKTVSIDVLDLVSEKQDTHLVYARMLFSHHAYMQFGNKHLIKNELNKSMSSVNYYLNRYSEEIEGSKVFVSLNKQVLLQLDACTSNI